MSLTGGARTRPLCPPVAAAALKRSATGGPLAPRRPEVSAAADEPSCRARALRALAGGQGLPVVAGDRRGHGGGIGQDRSSPRGTVWFERTARTGLPALLEHPSQPDGAVERVRKHPAHRQPGVEQVGQHHAGRRLGGEGRPGGTCASRGVVLGPAARQVKPPIHQSGWRRRRTRDLAVVHPAGRAGVLPRHAHRALLWEPCLVHHQNARLIPERLRHVVANPIAQRVGRMRWGRSSPACGQARLALGRPQVEPDPHAIDLPPVRAARL